MKRVAYRWFGTPFQWERASATEWVFDDGWGKYRLTYYGSDGWFLATPEDGDGSQVGDGVGEYAGDNVKAAITSEDTIKALADGMQERKGRKQ